MTVGEMLTDMRGMLQDPEDTFWPESEKVRYINEGYGDVVRRTLSYVMDDAASPIVTLSEGKSVYDVAAGKIVKILTIMLDTKRMWETSEAELDRFVPSWREKEGMPTHWFLEGDRLTVYPKPGAAEADEDLLIKYVKWPAALSEEDDEPLVPVSLHNAIKVYALARCLEKEGDTHDGDRAGNFADQYEELVEGYNRLRFAKRVVLRPTLSR